MYSIIKAISITGLLLIVLVLVWFFFAIGASAFFVSPFYKISNYPKLLDNQLIERTSFSKNSPYAVVVYRTPGTIFADQAHRNIGIYKTVLLNIETDEIISLSDRNRPVINDFFSPDGKQLIYQTVRENDIKKISNGYSDSDPRNLEIATYDLYIYNLKDRKSIKISNDKYLSTYIAGWLNDKTIKFFCDDIDLSINKGGRICSFDTDSGTIVVSKSNFGYTYLNPNSGASVSGEDMNSDLKEGSGYEFFSPDGTNKVTAQCRVKSYDSCSLRIYSLVKGSDSKAIYKVNPSFGNTPVFNWSYDNKLYMYIRNNILKKDESTGIFGLFKVYP